MSNKTHPQLAVLSLCGHRAVRRFLRSTTTESISLLPNRLPENEETLTRRLSSLAFQPPFFPGKTQSQAEHIYFQPLTHFLSASYKIHPLSPVLAPTFTPTK